MSSGDGAALLHEITGHHTAAVNAVAYVDKIGNSGGGIISVSDDKNWMIFLMRDGGDFWPSVAEELPAGGTALFLDRDGMNVYIGLQTGAILVYSIVSDFNAVTLTTTIPAHNDRVTAIHVDKVRKVIVSTSRDKRVCVHRLTDYKLNSSYDELGAWGTAMQYDETAPNIFVADFSGKIHVLKLLKDSKLSISSVAVLEGHDGSIRSLHWERTSGLLFSGSFDNTIKVWDIGGCKGQSYTLRGHKGKIKGLAYVAGSKQLISAGSDKRMVVWKIGGHTWKEEPQWNMSDECNVCNEPFMWNFSRMWEDKKVSVNRRHHCRWTGKSVCDKCSPHRATIPEMGHEFPARVCEAALPEITDKTPRAKTFPLNSEILTMHLIEHNGLPALISCGAGGNISMWNIRKGLLDGAGAAATEFVATAQTAAVASHASESGPAQSPSPQMSPSAAPTTRVYSTGADLDMPTKSLLDALDDDD